MVRMWGLHIKFQRSAHLWMDATGALVHILCTGVSSPPWKSVLGLEFTRVVLLVQVVCGWSPVVDITSVALVSHLCVELAACTVNGSCDCYHLGHVTTHTLRVCVLQRIKPHHTLKSQTLVWVWSPSHTPFGGASLALFDQFPIPS